MTSDRQRSAGWKIPEQIDDHELLCVQLFVPKNTLYLGAFNAALKSLMQWFSWEKSWESGDTRASEAAAYWRYLLDTYLCIDYDNPLEDDGVPCCCGGKEKSTRISESGIWQEFDTETNEWVDAPEDDPRNSSPQAPPLPGATTSLKKCAAADNVRNMFEGWKEQLMDILAAGTFVGAIIAAIIGFLGAVLSLSVVGTAVGVFLLGLAAALLQAGEDGVETEIDTEALDELRCILYQESDADGRYNDSRFQNVLARIDARFTGLAWRFFHDTIASMGVVGLNNATTAGASTSTACEDCEDCGCIPENMTRIPIGAMEMTYDPAPDSCGSSAGSDYCQWLAIPLTVEVTWPDTYCFDRITFWGYRNYTVLNPTALIVTVDEEVQEVPLTGGGGFYEVTVFFGEFHRTNKFSWHMVWGDGTEGTAAEMRHADPWNCPPPE